MFKSCTFLIALGSTLWSFATIAAPTLDHILESRQAGTVPPRRDPFYTAPSGFESRELGAILRSRSAPCPPGVTSCRGAHQLNYRTTDSNGRATFAVTTIFIPVVPSGGSTSRLLSYQTAYDSSNVDDSPSYSLYNGFFDPSIGIALGEGWFVNSPDYEGPLAAFTAGFQSGQATLDSLRAALNFRRDLGLRDQTRIALWGYSGGSIPSQWAAELQASYAPSLTLAGVAIGGVTPNITAVFLAINGGSVATLIVDSILGQITQDEPANQYVLDNLRTTGLFNRDVFLSTRTRPGIGIFRGFYSFQDIFDYFVPGRAILNGTPLRTAIDRNGVMGRNGIPRMPMYVYQSAGDEIAPIINTDQLIDGYCNQGARIFYQRNTFGNHGTEGVIGAERALRLFLRPVFDGTYNAGTSCNIETEFFP